MLQIIHAAGNSSSATGTSVDLTDSALDLYLCYKGGKQQAVKCQSQVMKGCSIRNSTCNCLNLNEWFDTCFAPSLMSTAGQCSSVASKVEQYRQNALDQCTILGLSTGEPGQFDNLTRGDPGNSATESTTNLAFTSFISLLVASFL